MWNKEKTDDKRQPGQVDDLVRTTNGQSAVVESVGALEGINAFVGKGVNFKGTISYHGTVRIDGTLEGEIHTEGTLLIGEDAVIKAKVTAGTIVCKGQITGDILAKEKVTLRAPAVINGGVETPMLSMEEGVQFNGTIEMSAPARTTNLAGENMVAAGAFS
jgi:cytoskeletal protein CcmA (bactofilin family)